MTTQTDDTRRILDLLSQGKITVDEADRLIKALAAGQPADSGAADATAGDRRARWFRINIRKPAKEQIIATFGGEKAAQRMKERGLDLDLSTINGDLSRMNGAEFDTFMRSLDEINIEIDVSGRRCG
jgi:hypothetical protein